MRLIKFLAGFLISLTIQASSDFTQPDYQPPVIQQLSATTLREFEALEADQGVAVDKRYFYAVDNSVIAKYERNSGKFIERWIGPKHGLIRHMNSCLAMQRKLWCANSNYSLTPMASSVEIFNTTPLEHDSSHSLGLMDAGSLVWFDKVNSGFIVGFAHYSKKGGEPYKSSEYSSVLLLDKQWRRSGGWAFPKSILERMKPYAASGGALGPKGLLYVMGHDLPEMYVLAKPTMGPVLLHIATIKLQAEGQAFSFDPRNPQQIWVVDRHAKKVRVIQLPPPPHIPKHAAAFR
ncbi:hypothetical protein P886_4893 [Alteromonadaceae bacterium 2753L.S.0a.02]|nr:hypothetical protein P886_4893 [Alteromonadaceae bacterium 2753L.S.0a.02]